MEKCTSIKIQMVISVEIQQQLSHSHKMGFHSLSARFDLPGRTYEHGQQSHTVRESQKRDRFVLAEMPRGTLRCFQRRTCDRFIYEWN